MTRNQIRSNWYKITSQVDFFLKLLPFHLLRWVNQNLPGFFCYIELIGVTLVNKIIQVSVVQFYNTSSVHCIVCSPPQVKSPSTTSPTLPHPNNPHTVVHIHEFFPLFFLNPTTVPHPAPQTSSQWQLSACFLSMGLSLFYLLVH